MTVLRAPVMFSSLGFGDEEEGEGGQSVEMSNKLEKAWGQFSAQATAAAATVRKEGNVLAASAGIQVPEALREPPQVGGS